jgi:hypothetical protein
MEEFGAIFSFVSLAGVLVIAIILFGPSLLSSYENWKIRQGLKGENPMSKIREIKEAMDTRLDQLEARATAAETLLQQTKVQAVHQFEAGKKRLSDSLTKLKSELARAKGITRENVQEVEAKFDHLQVQLALGKAEARDSFESQREKIRHSIATLEATVDRQLEASGQAIHGSLRKAANEFILAAIRLEAEMEFLAIQFKVRKDDSWARFTHEKRALILQINRYRDKLEEKKQMARDKAATVENELSNGMSQIKHAFKNVLD